MALNNQEVLLLFVFAVFMIPSLLANSVALYCTIADVRYQWTLSKEMLLVLTVVNISSSFGVAIYHLLITFSLQSTYWVCAVSGFVSSFFPLYSVGIGVLLAMERYLALNKPYWYFSNMFNYHLRLPMVFMAVLCALVCLMPSFGFGSVFASNRNNNATNVRICITFPTTPGAAEEAVFPIMYAVTGIVFITVLILCNIFVIKTLSQMRLLITSPAVLRIQREMNIKNNGNQTEFTLTKAIIALSVIFVVCLLPLNMVLIMVQLNHIPSKLFNQISRALSGLNTVISPVIYIAMIPRYHHKVQKIMPCISKIHKIQQPSSGQISVVPVE